jgi:hypothetical protein
MPNVNGMKFSYTPAGKAAAKKAEAKKVAVSSMRKKKSAKKQNFSGVKSQVYGG